MTHVFSNQKYRSSKMMTSMTRMRLKLRIMKLTLEAGEDIEAGEEEEASLFDVA